MSDKELYDYKDVFGHLPAAYNTGYNGTYPLNKMVEEKLIFRKRFQFTDTSRDFGEDLKNVKKSMETMAIILYVLSLIGVVLQVGQIIPGIPDIYAGGTVVAMLIAANAIQWRQSVKDRLSYAKRLAEMQQEHRAEVLKQQNAMMTLVENNQKAIQDILLHLKPWKE